MISVVLATYNSASVIGYSIRSILQQSFKDFEFLIVDDGSTDNTESIVRRFKDPRIRYMQFPHKGLPAALNAGLELATFNVIARMDAGDISTPLRLEKQYFFLNDKPENTIVASQYAVFNKTGIQYVVYSQSDHVSIRKRLALHSDISHSGVMYRKQFIINNGGYRDVPLEDYDLWLRIKDKAQFHILKDILLYVEYASNRLSTRNTSKKYLDQYMLQEKYYLNLNAEFGIGEIEEELEYRGWREYFFGDKTKARTWWLKSKSHLSKSPRILFAYVISYLPDSFLAVLKESRIRFRLLYYVQYYKKRNIDMRQQFRVLMGTP